MCEYVSEDVSEDERPPCEEDVHVHISNKFQIKYNHLLTWFLPQLKSKEYNVLAPLDPGVGRVTNGLKTVGQNSKLVLTTTLYNVVIVLDMSASMFTVDMDHKKVIIEELDEALMMCITPLCTPEIHPWRDDSAVKLDVNLTVLAYIPQFKNRFISVLIQGYPLNSATSSRLTDVLVKRCAEMHDFIKSRSDQASWKYSEQGKSDKHGLCGLIGEVLNILKIQRSRVHVPVTGECSEYDNSKNVMIMITDGVIGETHQARQIVHRLHERTTSCSFVRVGPYDPDHYGFGYIPNISLLKFISEASGGRYWDWGKKSEINVEKVFQWSPFRDPPDTRGLIQKTVQSLYPTQLSLTSTITKKIVEGFKICDVNVRSQGLAPDFSGTEITALYVTMALTWRKRVHVTYELLTDLPIEPYSVQKIPKVKVTLCIYGDYEVINGKHSEDEKHRTPVKLLDQFQRFLDDQLRPHQDDTYEKRWIFDLHNYPFSSLSKLSIEQTSQKSEPYKIERMTTTPDQEMNHFNKFWLRLLDEKAFIDSHFDVYLLKCCLQFDLNLPKCLTGITRSYKNNNKEFQIYSRSHGFLLDVLVKWCNIMIEKEVYIKLYETKSESHSKHSFVWVTVHLSSCASRSIYIAMHRDIPFFEQQKIRQELVSKLLSVKFQGSLLLDSSIKVGLDTTLKKRVGSFIPFNLKAEYACQQIPKNIDEIISGSVGFKRGDQYLHKLVCNWKTCPDVNCCSDDLIKELRNEIFNALFRVRLQDEFRPLHVSGKIFSCFLLLKMKSGCSLLEDGGGEVTCLLQYVITVDDDVTTEKKDERKISSDFTTEVVIEPQWGTVDCKKGNLTYLDGLQFQKIPPQLFERDFKLVTSLCTFATIKKLCSQPDKHQPEFSNQCRLVPTSFKEPVSTPELPYLFLVSNLLTRSHLNVLNFPLLTLVTHNSQGDTDPEFLTGCTASSTAPSPNTHLLHSLSELLELSYSRHIDLSQDELRAFQESVRGRVPVGEKVTFNERIPETAWKCYVRFHKFDNKDDKTRLQFVLIPEPPDNFTESQIRDWFPNGTVDVFVFDCLYKILLGTFTNPQRCSLEKLHSYDKYIDDTEDVEQIQCPSLIYEIIEESTSTQSSPYLERSLKFVHVGEICKAYEKSYILGVHQAVLRDTPLQQTCVDTALEFLEKPRLQDLHIKKETKHIPLAKYLGAVCSHVSGQLTCCHNARHQEPHLNQSLESSDRDVTSESYSADIEATRDSRAIGDDASNNYTTVDNSLAESDEDSLSTPCQNENMWTRVVSAGLPLGSHNVPADVYCAEIVSASSAELTPVIDDKRIEESLHALRSNYHDQHADIDIDSGGSSMGEHPLISEEGEAEEEGEGEEEGRPGPPIKSSSVDEEGGDGSKGLTEAMTNNSQSPAPTDQCKEVSLTEIPVDMPSLHVSDPLNEKKVSFLEKDVVSFSTSSENNYSPVINVIANTPVLPSEEKYRVATEEHQSIKEKFDDIIDSRFLRISHYTDRFLIMRSDNSDNMDSFTTERHPVLFMKMSCQHAFSPEITTIKTVPTCVLDVVSGQEKRKRDIDLWFTCYTLPAVVAPSPIYRSPTHSFNSRPHRRKDSYKKSDHDSKAGDNIGTDCTPDCTAEHSHSAHQLTVSNAEDTDDGLQEYPVSKTHTRANRCRDHQLAPSSSSSPNLTRQNTISDPIIRRSILEDMYEDVKWLIDDQYMTHLRRKTPVTLDVLKQVLEHCKRAPASSQNCNIHSGDLAYVDTWVVKDERGRQDGDKQRHDEKMRHEELLAKIVLATEFESYSLCRIDNFFYYSLSEENEQLDVSGREVLSNQSSISSMGSRPSHYRSSSSSLAEEIPISTECTMRPCSKCWIVVQVSHTHFQVAYQTADMGYDCQIDHTLLHKIISQIQHLNKIQNQEFLLHQINMESRLCPKELLYNHTPLPHGEGYNNTYVCDVVHRIEVELWDKKEEEGLLDIRNSLFNFKCYNQNEFVYYNIQDAKNDRATFYFQLPEPSTKLGVKPKKLYIDVRGLQPPDPDKQSTFDHFVQQKLEEAKLEDIAHRLNRNSQAKLTAEEVSFLSYKKCRSYRTMYVKIPPYVYDYLPHFWFYLDQHLVQQQDLFCPRYDSTNDKRIQFTNEKTQELETTRDNEVFIKLKIGNRTGHHEGRYTGRSHLHKDLFQSLLLVNITIVGPDNQPIDFNKKWFNKKSPVFEPGGYEPPQARQNEDIKPTNKLDERTRLSLKLRILEKRKKAGSVQKSDREFESSLFQAIQAAYISLLLEVYILPVELTIRKASAIVACVEDELSVTPKQMSSSLGGKTGGLLSMMKGRRNSQEGLDTLRDLETKDNVITQRRFLRTWSLPPELSEIGSTHPSEQYGTRADQGRTEHVGTGQKVRRKMPTSSSKDENRSLHPNLRDCCIDACRVGAQAKTKIVEHHFMQIPSLFVSNQVINKIIEGLWTNFKVRIFGRDSDYKMIPPTCHREDEIENSGIVLVARRLSLLNDSRIKLHGPDLMLNDEKPNIEQILALETGTIDVTREKLDVPRQMHIVVLLNCKKLNFYFYNVHKKQVITPFMASIKALVSWLNTRKMVLNRILLLKARHELPPHYAQSELLPQTEDELDAFIEETEPPLDQPAFDQSKQQSTFKNKEIASYYEHLYDHYHPGVIRVVNERVRSRDPLKIHGSQLGAYMRAAEQKKEEEEKKVDLDDPDLPNNISREQAKLLKKNARLIHYIASPLLFSSKLKSSRTDKETFSYVSNTTNDIKLEEPAWFLHFKNQLFDKFIAYLKDPARGINMTLKYEPRGSSKDVEISNTLNDDDNEALLCKETLGGGRILLGVLIQNSTFCVKLYGFDSDNRLRLFQECNNLKTHTHTNSFNYDWMVHAIYDSLIAHREGVRVKQILPIHHCVQSVMKHYETVAEPPHTRCWIKQYSDLVYKSQAKHLEYNINAESLHEYIVQNQEELLNVFTIPADTPAGTKKGEEAKLLVVVPQDMPGDFQNNFKLAIIVSELTYNSAWEFGLSYYIILASQFINSPQSTLLKDPSYTRTRNESMTTISMSSSPGSEDGIELCDSRSRINSQIFSVYNAKQELYQRAKREAEMELKDVLQCAQKSYHRDALIQKLLRPPSSKNTISLELSYHSFLKDDFTYHHLLELEGDLSFNKNLLEERSSIYKLLQDWNYPRFKKLLEFLRGKVEIVIINDPNTETGKAEIGIITKKTPVAGKRDKVSIVVVKRTKYFNLDVFAILKNQEECRDLDHIQFWERILSLICVYVWERLIL